MSTQTITEFLEARIAEDELAAYDRMGEREGDRTLAECAAKRAIVQRARHLTEDKDAYWAYREYAEHNLFILAAVYADHAEFQQEWAL